MAQDFNTLSTSNIIREDVARHNQNYATLKSNFSGNSFPSNATAGQSCWRIDRGLEVAGGGYTGALYNYTGNTALGENGWVLDEDTTLLKQEIVNSRGSKLTLDQRLDISMNEDGTLKSGVQAFQSEWVAPSLTFTFINGTSFKTDDNTADIYTEKRRLKINLTSGTLFSEVVSSVYDGVNNETTVTILDDILLDEIISIEHSLISTGSNSSLQVNIKLDEKLDKSFVNFTEKVTPVDSDLLVLNDSEDSNNQKKVTFQKLKENIVTGIDSADTRLNTADEDYVGQPANEQILNSNAGEWIKNQCTAWVNFDGTTTPPTIRDSYNVSDVVRTATGKYEIYFKEQMNNINYNITASGSDQANSIINTRKELQSISKAVIYIRRYDTTSFIDSDNVALQIFGGKN